jgi:glycosyltransferase involved in cell wall biosynthesis
VSRPALTVLTAPIRSAPRRLYTRVRGIGRRILDPGSKGLPGSKYPGHYALVRSVVEGLREIGADFNFNPESFSNLSRLVYAPANEALLQAAQLKRGGRIDFLVAGPVNALFADEHDSIIQMPEIDLVIVPSEWTLDFYREIPALVQKSRICPCGVDADLWQPAGARKERAALVYWKSGGERFCEEVEAMVRRCGLEPVRVRSRPGEHNIFTPEELRGLLDRSILGVFLSTFETQGIALAEAWSMNVPTIVWDPQADAEWRGRHFTSRSSAPYLTPSTGIAARDTPGIEPAIRQALATLASFQPREWVLANMTDAICSRKLFELIRRESEAGRAGKTGWAGQAG